MISPDEDKHYRTIIAIIMDLLPVELLENIFSYVTSLDDLFSYIQVNTQWKDILNPWNISQDNYFENLFQNHHHVQLEICKNLLTDNYLEYIYESGCVRCLNTILENKAITKDKICNNLAGNGHLECLKYVHENGCPWDAKTCYHAAWRGKLECLKYAHENGCPWDKYTCENAAKNGQLECLKYAHENGCPSIVA